MSANSSSYQRPFQSRNATKSEGEGRTLLDLIRSRDKLLAGQQKTSSSKRTPDDGNDESELLKLDHELTTRLHSLNASIRRCGLFPSAERARSYYDNASERSSSSSAAAAGNNADNASGGGSTGSKKRKRKKGGAGGGSGNSSGGPGLSAVSYGIYLDSHSSSTPSFLGISCGDNKCDLDEGLVMTVICRILRVTVGRKKKGDAADKASSNPTRNDTSFELVCAALNVLSSICDHAKDGMTNSPIGGSTVCASIEGEMVGSIGSPLLDALCDNILYSFYRNDHGDSMSKSFVMYFKACSSVVSLLETRLSRAEKTVQSLREIAWLVLNNLSGCSGGEHSHSVQKAATALLATLALVGNLEGTPASKVWSQSVSDGIVLLRWAIHDFFPMPTVDEIGSGNVKDEAKEHPKLWKEHMDWVSVAKEAPAAIGTTEVDLGNDPTDNHRSNALRSRIQSLTGYIHSLLQMEAYPLLRFTLLLPLDILLDTAEILLSFPLAAEATYRSTKSRLRSSPVKDGLISPNAAMEICVDVRCCGHAILDATVEFSRGGGGALLLGKARHIVGMSVANLASSCSAALVSVVVDNGRRMSSGGSAGSWLRGSIPMRIQSIKTFHSVAISLGSGVMSSAGTVKLISRALVLSGGCLLEQVALTGECGDGTDLAIADEDEWGTLGDRTRLVETSSIAMASCIAAFGGLIPNDVRSTLESITYTCLSTLYSCGGNSIMFAYSHVKRSILQLGMNCVCVPWGDGGRSGTMMEIVRVVSTMLRNDSDLSVASMALSTLCALDAFVTPRAPSILIPTRGSVVDESTPKIGVGITASGLLQGMSESKMEIVASKFAKDERVRSKKKTGKSNKKNKKKDENKVRTKTPPLDTGGEKMKTDKKSQVSKETSTPKETVPSLHNREIETSPSNPDNHAYSKKHSNIDPMTKESIESTGAKANIISAREPPQYDQCSASHQDESSGESSDKDDVVMDTEENDDANGDNDHNSLDDFPDIVDEDPDEEDIV